eukprot:TRINITY_DN14613_c0_g1_i2.p1 TRINITY_DN14613_c0_g1~~TRINITY_DN14613_c0_g1_i2.p1  ORF type:complete len:334 (-),score=92.31 TRINITY_DN14613_c0_g1_i2:131-1132(-)
MAVTVLVASTCIALIAAERPGHLTNELSMERPNHEMLGDKCRCHATTLECKKNQGFWSRAWNDVPMGFCEIEVEKEELKEALASMSDIQAWSQADLQAKMEVLRSKRDAFRAAITTKIGDVLQDVSIMDTPSKNWFAENNRPKEVFATFSWMLMQAGTHLEYGGALVEAKRKDMAHSDCLIKAIDGVQISQLETCIAAAEADLPSAGTPDSQAHCSAQCAILIEQAKKRKQELIKLKGDVWASQQKTLEGMAELGKASAELEKVGSLMDKIQATQDDLGRAAQEIMSRDGALQADDFVKARVEMAEQDLQLESSSEKLRILSESAAETMRAMA